jgi:hypothetical protein
VGLRRGPLSLVSTFEELFERKSSGGRLISIVRSRTNSTKLLLLLLLLLLFYSRERRIRPGERRFVWKLLLGTIRALA